MQDRTKLGPKSTGIQAQTSSYYNNRPGIKKKKVNSKKVINTTNNKLMHISELPAKISS